MTLDAEFLRLVTIFMVTFCLGVVLVKLFRA
jgi:hypothetical protein